MALKKVPQTFPMVFEGKKNMLKRHISSQRVEKNLNKMVHMIMRITSKNLGQNPDIIQNQVPLCKFSKEFPPDFMKKENLQGSLYYQPKQCKLLLGEIPQNYNKIHL